MHFYKAFLALLLAAVCTPTASATLHRVLDYLVENEARYVQDLTQLVAIPSVSATPERLPDLLRAGQWMATYLRAAGLKNVQVLQNPKGPRPAIYADFITDAKLPTVLIYGHFDVQPADPEEAWTVTPPFTPLIKDGALFGRGASDNKGGIAGAIQAVEALLAVDGAPPVNIKIIVEGEEEIGSPYLGPFLEEHAETLSCDAVLSADGNQISETQPGIVLGLRGAAALEVEVSALRGDAHSGMVGGGVQNPSRALIQLINTMFDPVSNAVTVKGFYDRVRGVTAADRDDIMAANYDEAKELVERLGAVQPFGEAGFSTLERIWLRPTLEVVGIAGGFAGAGIKTVIPATAIAKLAARLVPDQNPLEILALVEAHIKEHHPPACNVTVRELGFKSFPFSTRREGPVVAAAARVLERVMGAPPQYVRGGATIPAMAAFQKQLKAVVAPFGFALPSDSVHAPDERYQLRQYSRTREAFARVLYELGNEAKEGRFKPRGAVGDHSEL